MMKLDIKNFDKICRICLTKKLNMTSVFDASIPDMLRSFACIQLSQDDGLPQSICLQCLTQISRSYTFKQQCEKADQTLRQFKEQLPIKKKKKKKKIKKEPISTENADVNMDICQNTIEYNLQTEQLKMEISEHLKIGCDTGGEAQEAFINDIIKVYECSYCGLLYQETWHLKQHIKEQHEGINNYICMNCDQKFSSLEILTQHACVFPVVSEDKNEKIKKTHVCDICQKTFRYPSTLQKHKNAKHSENDEKQEQRCGNVKKKYMCEVCHKRFHTKNWLTIHMKMHTPERSISSHTNNFEVEPAPSL